MATQLLALANSFKSGGRCLAGVDDANDWVRPVADEGGASIPASVLEIGGRSVQPGDLINVGLGAGVPLYFQGENVLLRDSPITYGPPTSAAVLQSRLVEVASRVPPFAQSPRSAIEASEYSALVSDSLALLHTEELTIAWRTNVRGMLRPRAIFMTAQGGWDIPYTGNQWAEFPERTPGARRIFGGAFVTVSVGESFGGGSTHYVLAAGVLAAA